MRPLHVHTLIDGLGWGGAEMLLAELASATSGAGIRMTVGYLKEKDGSPAADRLRAEGVEAVHVGSGRLVDPSSFRAVRAHLAAVRPDLVHTHLGYSDLLGGVAARTLGIPSVATIHLAHWDRPDGRRDDAKLWLFARARRHCAGRVVTVSDAARRTYLDRGWDQPGRVVTVHNGVRDAVPASEGARVRAELGLAPDDVVVTMLSVLREGKGHHAAFEAVARLSRLLPDAAVRLVVLGDGPLRGELERAAQPLGRRVVLTGHRDDVRSVLAATDVLLHPSEQDAFPTALLEAMAAGVTVVATDVGGIPEIVLPDVTGVLVPAPAAPDELADALARVLGSPARRQELAAAARRRYEEQFSADVWAGRLRAVYDEVLRVSGRPTGA